MVDNLQDNNPLTQKEPRVEVSVHFLYGDGEEKVVIGKVGETLLDLAHRTGVELEGACQGSLSCSTCHVVVDQSFFNKIPEATDDENDLLDLAIGLQDTSRLGCQIILTPELDGLRVVIPSQSRHMNTIFTR